MQKTILATAILLSLYYPICKGGSSNSQSQIKDDSTQIIEKVYLHTDRNYYYSGDDVWFKAYLIDAQYRLLTNHSKSLHVEIISPESKIIDSRTIRLKDGLGNGDFKLPENLPSGSYLLRAYTNYMRNYSDQIFFNKEVTIINTSKKEDESNDTLQKIKKKKDIFFFPEGGSLVDSVSSVVAFKATNDEGLGYDVSGEIFSSSGELVTTFKSTRLGMGKFSLKPINGITYHAIAKTADGDILRVDVPKSFSTGVTFSITKNKSNKLLIAIETNKKTLPLLRDQELLLTISARNEVIKTIRFKVNTISSNFILPVEDLPDGVVMFTLTSIDNIPLTERLIFIQQHADVRVKVQTDKAEYKTREQVSVNIFFPEYKVTKQEAYLSLSAVENISYNYTSQFPSTICSWFLLESDIRGLVEEPSYYFDPDNVNRQIDLDLLLMTQGWRDFEWKYDTASYYPAEMGFKVSGRVRRALFNVPIVNSMVNIEIQNSMRSTISTIPTDSLGRFSLDAVDLTGNAKLIVSTLGNKKRLQGMVLIDSITFIPAKVNYNFIQNRLFQRNKFTVLIQNEEQKETVRRMYHLSDTIPLQGINVIAKKQINDIQSTHVNNVRSIYGTPDEEFVVTPESDNTKFVDLLRRVRGFVIQGEGFNVSIMLRGPSSLGSGISSSNSMPLFLIDGVPTTFINAYNFPTDCVDRIDVLVSPSSTSKYGMQGSHGVVSIITKASVDIPTEGPTIQVAKARMVGYSTPRVFYSPQHNSDKESIYTPDQRNTLFWQPNIKLDNKKKYTLNYFNADNSSTITIVLEGMTNDGIPIVGKTEYTVK